MPDENESMALCVDLDGTLIKTDLTAEAVIATLKRRPLLALRLPVWLLRGRAHLKRQLAAHRQLDLERIPFNDAVVDFVRAQKASGRLVVLATAADDSWARQVADRLQIFDHVLASDGRRNLKGAAKLAGIQALLSGRPFHYAGDDFSDLPIWRHCQGAIVVGNEALAGRVRKIARVIRVFPLERSRSAALLAAARPKHWMKNMLVFVPYVTSHSFFNLAMIWRGILAFAALSLCASGAYIFNDVLDIESDRAHPTKKRRPFASADLPMAYAPFLALVLPAAGFFVARSLPPLFTAFLALYVMTTAAYSLVLKRIIFIDVLCLAGLYTLRILAGHAVSGIEYSAWLMMFSVFFFLSLAIMKRYTELLFLQEHDKSAAPGRGYRLVDMRILLNAGKASGFVAALIFALYIVSDKVRTLYRHPNALWLICLLLCLWVNRIWLLARKGVVKGDPLLFVMSDRVSYLLGLASAAAMTAAGVIIK